ncbi:IclR family transcriptional regulator domain-containing protein, partial [Tsukamurella soli]
ALLAAAPPDVLQRVLAGGLAPVGPRTITAPGTLAAHLRRIAASGISYEHEESAAGVACVACVIAPDGGEPVGAVSATGWIGKVDIRRVGPAVRTTALTIARELTATENS